MMGYAVAGFKPHCANANRLMRRPEIAARLAELLTTFADQAVIAIENVRLFDEIQDKSYQLESRAGTSRNSYPA
jgi:GAF domain-containing protein